MTIAQVAEKFGLSADTLRYYEKIGLIPAVGRTAGGIRNYDEDSCRWIELMKCMRQSGVQIEALAKYVELFRRGEDTMSERKEILLQQRALLIEKRADIQTSLDKIDHKIASYYGNVECSLEKATKNAQE